MNVSLGDVLCGGDLTATIASPLTPATPQCSTVPRLRKSVSDPTDLLSAGRRESVADTLAHCTSLLSLLNSRVDGVTDLVRVMPGSCSKCHGQTGSDHAGSRWGFDACTLDHSDGCVGGKTEIPGKRAACPDGFVPKLIKNGSESEVSLQRDSELEDESSSESDSSKKDDPDWVPPSVTREGAWSSSAVNSSASDSLQAPSSSLGSSIAASFTGTTEAQSKLSFGPGFGGSLMSSGFVGNFSAGATALPSSSSLSSGLFGASAMIPGFGGLGSGIVNTAVSNQALLGNSDQQQFGMGLSPFMNSSPQNWMLQQFLQQQQSQFQQQQQDMMLRNQRIMEEMKTAVEEAKQAARSAASTRPKSRQVSFSDSVGMEAEVLKTANAKQPTQCRSTIGLDMNSIRNTPGLREEVETIMDNDVYTHPSLARTPSAGTPLGACALPAGTSTGVTGRSCLMTPSPSQYSDADAAEIIATLRADLEMTKTSFETLQKKQAQPRQTKAARRAERREAAERVERSAREERKAAKKTASEKLAAALMEVKLAKQVARTAGVADLSSDSSSDSDDESDMDKTITRKKKTGGNKATSPMPVLADSDSGEDVSASVLTDKHGRAYMLVAGELKPLQSYVRDPVSGSFVATTPTPQGSDSSSSTDSVCRTVSDKKKKKKKRQRAAKAAQQEVAAATTKVQGIIPIAATAKHLPPVPNLQNKGKGNEESKLSVVDWGRMCPIKYAATCNSKNMNLPVFVWAKLAELRALQAGVLGTKLQPGELDARMRHLQCVLELVGTNSTLAEYSGYGWQLGRDYDSKVQATMDCGSSDWVSFNSMFALGPHPSFVLSAKDEVEKFSKKQVAKDDDPAKLRKKVCNRFNSCKTAKRCEWEVENPNSGRCKKLHQCSYCKDKHNKNQFHQAWDCPAGGKEAVTAGTHSL